MSNLNHMICPTCGHDFYVQAAYATCDACQTLFYASGSKTVTRNQHALGAVPLDNSGDSGHLIPRLK